MKPNRVLLFIAAVMASLAVLCVVLPGRIAWGEKKLRWPTLAEVVGKDSVLLFQISNFKFQNLDATDTIPEFPVYTEEATPDKEAVPEPIKPQPVIPAAPKVVVDSTTDSRMFLKSFYAALDNADEDLVRVLHYGDSQIEEDRMTQQIREALQARFGGRGVGMMPLAQTIPTLTVKQELRMSGRRVQPTQGPKRYLIYSFKRDQRPDGLYGPMGQMAEMNDSLVNGSEEITAICKPIGASAQYDCWRLFADTTIRYLTHGDTIRLSGRGNVYALSQQSHTGVIVDNIPMRGCLGLVFTKIDREQLTSFYRDQHVRLIIMQFGGNAIPSNRNATTIQSIVRGLREQVRYIQGCAPDADILFIGPSDMLTQTDGEWQTYPMVPYMDKLLRKMALEENIAYFSLFRWMGGSGSMIRWQEAGLAGTDGVHFTRAGAKKAGKAVANWILEGAESQKPKAESEE